MMSPPANADIIGALTAFYQEVAKQTHVNESDLKLPPAAGWDTIDPHGLRAQGKSDAVIDFLKHIPYFEHERQKCRPGDSVSYGNVLVVADAAPINYARQRGQAFMDRENPLPGDCVYLTKSESIYGFDLILDTERGTITEYTRYGDSTEDYELSDTLPDLEKWRAHRTSPAVGFFESQTRTYARLINMLVPGACGFLVGTLYSRSQYRETTQELSQETEPLEEWHPDAQELQKLVGTTENTRRLRNWKNVANIYNCYLRHGWPDAFNQSACQAELIKLEDLHNSTNE